MKFTKSELFKAFIELDSLYEEYSDVQSVLDELLIDPSIVILAAGYTAEYLKLSGVRASSGVAGRLISEADLLTSIKFLNKKRLTKEDLEFGTTMLVEGFVVHLLIMEKQGLTWDNISKEELAEFPKRTKKLLGFGPLVKPFLKIAEERIKIRYFDIRRQKRPVIIDKDTLSFLETVAIMFLYGFSLAAGVKYRDQNGNETKPK